MGGAITYVYRDGSRLTPWMLHQINRLDAAFHAQFGLNLRVSSGIRTHEEQRAIFLARYTRTPNGRKVYDTRWWNGAKWYRVSPAGTVAVPGASNHEIQGSKAAVDLRDTGRDAGVTTRGTARANWLRANAPKFGLVASGYYFGEPWHFDVLNIFTEVAVPAGEPADEFEPVVVPEEDEDDMMFKPTVHARTNGKGDADEWMLGHPGIGVDLPVFEGTATSENSRLTADKSVKVFRGFMVTVDRDVFTAWARTYAKGTGEITSSTDRAGYIAIQKQLSRVSDELT